MNTVFTTLLALMMDGGPTVMGFATSLSAVCGFACFITGASAVIVAYILKKRKDQA